MNAARYPHLDLEDLIAGAAGQPVKDRTREHLASCEHCQREASRWNLVADGVRDLAAAAPQTPPQPARETARPRRTERHGPAGPWRRALLVAGGVAAALVLLAGIGEVTGYVHISTGSGTGPGSGTALTAVTGCSQLQQADGTLQQVTGSNLVIKTVSGQPVTVTTTAATFMSMSGPLLGAITDGAAVQVRGPKATGTITAAIITVGQPFTAVNPPGSAPVQGTVADAAAGGFTLVTSAGTRIPVTTSAGTLVVIPHARPGQLHDGTAIFALGQPGPDRTLTARAVAAITQLSSGPRLGVSVKDCTTRSIDEALGTMSTGKSVGSAGQTQPVSPS